MKQTTLFGILLTFFLYGCNPEETVQIDTLNIRLLATGMSTGETTGTEYQINMIEGFRFEDGILKEKLTNLILDENGMLSLQPSQMYGDVYFVANASTAVPDSKLIVGETNIDDFLNITASIGDMTANGLAMTGHIQLSSNTTTATLTRSVSRIDLYSPFKNVKVYNVKIDGIATEGYLNIQEQPHSPENSAYETYEKNYNETPFENGRVPLLYVCEQGKQTHNVEIIVTTDEGAWHRLSTTLPNIRRNTIYTLKVYGNGAEMSVEVITDDWSNGNSTESVPVLKGLVDKEASQLSEGVEISESGDTVYIPYWKSNFQLTLKGEEHARFVINGHVDGVELTTQNITRSLQQIAEININSSQKMPGSVQEYIYLDAYLQNVHTGRVVLVFKPNPIQLTGKIHFDPNGICDFNKYVDGELASINIPSDKKISLHIDPQEDPWLKIEQDAENTAYRIIAGWKPNDPNADGRIQEAELIVTDNDGNRKEIYTIKRQNWGLPVVNINGTWWCKYNLRGNVKTFSDQILIQKDPTADGRDLFDYLQNCNNNELLQLLGDQYQAGNPDGLKLVQENGAFLYEGFKTTSDNFGTIAPTEMAPEGYQIPDYNDFRFFTWNNNSNLGYQNPGVFNNNLGQRINYGIVERDLVVDGIKYGPIELYNFNYEGAQWTMLGLGHQWDATSISKNTILLATYGDKNNTWSLEGYPKSDGRGNWFKYSNNNAYKTRTIRCIKTPVEYIYE